MAYQVTSNLVRVEAKVFKVAMEDLHHFILQRTKGLEREMK